MMNPKRELSQDSNDRSEIVFDVPQPDGKKRKVADPSLTLRWGVVLKDEAGEKAEGYQTSEPPVISRMSRAQYVAVGPQFEPRDKETKPRPNSKRAGFGGLDMELSSIKRPSDTDYRDDLSIHKPMTARNPFRKSNDFIIKTSAAGVQDIVDPANVFHPALSARSTVRFDMPKPVVMIPN